MRNHPPLVGIGLPVYNGARYLEAALDSIVAQSLTDFELVICDNASTDGTEAICRRYAARDGRIRYYRNAANIGGDPNFNLVFDLSRGKYFKFVPHDDVMEPDYLAACVDALDENPDAVVCQTQLRFIDQAGQDLGICSSNLYRGQSPRPSQRFTDAVLTPHNCYDMMGVCRRSMLDRAAPMQSFHGADRTRVAELAVLGRFLHLPRPLLKVRDHPERYSRADPSARSAWHDPRLAGKRSVPTWRLYRNYTSLLRYPELQGAERLTALTALARWWFVNWNAVRIAVDVTAAFAPGIGGLAERVKQAFSPAPGIDQVRKARRSQGSASLAGSALPED
jgi:glycosyltransferase involved in cell wall biosynthesis